ncbi:hypothetical protein CMUS01_11901 [Colletotrichum musicola]|uniref:Uncharacterized protein n=1 Tax=Colletotrichum musicola TaxID=2175873 RepID=A0A8H6N3U6_9PEZI|nr:hypothetical protein CMUS01_11901 [Colletotrichum musicola]
MADGSGRWHGGVGRMGGRGREKERKGSRRGKGSGVSRPDDNNKHRGPGSKK